jgi:hypothetical protein
MPEKLLVFNGINGATGEYGIAPMTGEESDTPGEAGGLMSVTASKAVVRIMGCHRNVETE